MFKLTRVTKEPASPIHIMVDHPNPDPGDGKAPDAGLAMAGSHHFYPAESKDGPDTHYVTDRAAREIMRDPKIARHFECDPPIDVKPAEPAAQPAEPAAQPKKAKGTGKAEEAAGQ